MPKTYHHPPRQLTNEEQAIKTTLAIEKNQCHLHRMGPNDLLFEVLWGGNHNLVNWLNFQTLPSLQAKTDTDAANILYQKGCKNLATARGVFLLFLNVDDTLKQNVMSGTITTQAPARATSHSVTHSSGAHAKAHAKAQQSPKLYQCTPYNPDAAQRFFAELRRIIQDWLKNETKNILMLIDDVREAYIIN